MYYHYGPLGGHLVKITEVAYWPDVNLRGVYTDIHEYTLGADIMAPFPKSTKQNQYLLVLVDYCSKWVALFPSRWTTAPKIASLPTN